jgi:hypothetical protein
MASKKQRSKSKQKRSGGNPSNYSQLYKSDTSGVPAAESQKSKAQPKAAAPATPVSVDDTLNWQQEYAYVFRDLRFLFLVSALLFAGMLILGFFL